MPQLPVHRHVKTSAIVTVVIILLLTGVYFFLQYRTGQVVKLIVENQSNGQFHIDINDLDLSVLHHRIELSDAVLQGIDSTTMKVNFTITLPRVFLRVSSWRSLLLQKKIFIDSAYLESPSFETSADSNAVSNGISFQAAEIFKGVQTVVDLLNVSSFQLTDGSFILHTAHLKTPFEIHHIAFSIRNFRPDEKNSNRFMSADEIEVSIPNQTWKLEEGVELKFSQLHFSGKNLRLDSCEFISNTPGSNTSVLVRADQISFQSDSLPAFYEQNELIIDTLLCVHPVVQIQINGSTESSDTSATITESIKSLLPGIRVKNFEIQKGQVSIVRNRPGKNSNYTTNETDLTVKGLSFQPKDSAFFKAGDINLQLKEITFYTPDSLYQLAVEEFELVNFEVRFKNARFSPASGSHNRNESFLVMIPVLSLHNLNLEDLLEKRLGAEMAEMISPVITIASHGESKKKETTTGNLEGFYRGLHGLSELLHVKTLQVSNASFNYTSPVSDSLKASMTGLNSTVALNDFLNSSTLIDIKHSVPFFEVNQIKIRSKKVNATFNDFHLHGELQHNGIDSIYLQMANGLEFQIKKFYWHNLDWDSVVDKHSIIADSVNIKRLTVGANNIVKRKQQDSSQYPSIQIRMVAVNKFEMNYKIPDAGFFSAKGRDFLLNHLHTSRNGFLWSAASGDFTSVKYKSNDVRIAIDRLTLKTPGETRMKDIEADFTTASSVTRTRIHEMKVVTDITSTDLSNLNLQSLYIDKPKLSFSTTKTDTVTGKSFTSPLNLVVGQLNVKDGQIDFKRAIGTDTTRSSGNFNLSGTSIFVEGKKDKVMRFEKMDASLSEFTFNNDQLHLKLPSAEFNFLDGNSSNDQGNFLIHVLLSGKWNNGEMMTEVKKGSQLSLKNFSGTLDTTTVDIKPGEKLYWLDWIKSTRISNARIRFTDSSKIISAGNASWNEMNHTLQIDSFHLEPKMKARDYFRKTSWQSDFIRLNGETIVLAGLDPDTWMNDSILKIHKITLLNTSIDVTRDKRFPFRHGIEKMMPTKLINSLSIGFNIDSIEMQNGSVTYHEFSTLTNREGIVPFENINAVVKKFTNDHQGRSDTLSLKGTAQLLDCNITKFHYKEVYNDSLSSFLLTLKTSPMELTGFSKVSRPLAAIEVTSGYCDTVNARVSGNKYAAIGQMQFNYHDLKLNLLNHQDTLNKRFSLTFVNFVANSFVIRSNNEKISAIFTVRDQERFIFNYWTKTFLSGVLTSAGIKNNGKYYKQYTKMKSEYTLPELTF